VTEVAVSVIVCTRDRPSDLGKCIESVLANPRPDLELIVADQSAGKESEEIARGIAARDDRLKYFRIDRPGKSKALNKALAEAKGATLLHTDDDCTVPADWVERHLAVFAREPDVGIIFGALAAPPIDWSTAYVPTFRPERFRRFSGRMAFLRVGKIGVGANAAVRRAVYDRIKGFDECLGPGCRFRSGDEWDMAYRALKAGFIAAHDPDNVVLHWGIREYSDGTGRNLLRNKSYGVGAGFSKHVRCGDTVALLALAAAAGRELRYLGMNLIRKGRPSGAGRLFYMAKGVFDGIRQPVDHGAWLYETRPEGRQA
jgi:glycosyltransferase involved in cell wall biosynthesis